MSVRLMRNSGKLDALLASWFAEMTEEDAQSLLSIKPNYDNFEVESVNGSSSSSSQKRKRPTFYRIYRNKTTEQFQCTPYIVALMNALLWSYYSILVAAYPLLFINMIGAVLRIGYILIFLQYADLDRKIRTWKMCILLDIAVVLLVLIPTMFLTKGSERILLVGWICVGSAISAFAAPLTIIRHVIRTRSAEFMPLPLSLFLTLSAATWTAYGFDLGDIHITVASVLGLVLGLIQILLYMIFGNQARSEENQGPATEMQA